jgi:hypothetical protein
MWSVPQNYKRFQNNRGVRPGEFSSVREAVKKRVSWNSAAVKRRLLCVIAGVCNSVRLL